MRNGTNLSYVHDSMIKLEEYFSQNFKDCKVSINNENKYVIFLSIGSPSMRAFVLKDVSTDLMKTFERFRSKLFDMMTKRHLDLQWIKVDIVKEVQPIHFTELEKLIAKTRKNYFRYGISFDVDFQVAFLEQEINGNAMIKNGESNTLQLDDKNINYYLKNNYGIRFPFIKDRYRNKPVFIFTTNSVFLDKSDGKLQVLNNGMLMNGIRRTNDIASEVYSIINKSTYYLMNLLKSNGKFEYGYFSSFAKRIGTYNILRHASSLYALAEGYEVLKDKQIIQAVQKGIDYLIREAIVYKNEETKEIAYVVDYTNNNEIKLGSNATAILAMTKYMEVTNTKKYIEVAQALARGIVEMKTSSGGFVHVLSYPSFEIKDVYRVIYYEGEAVFSLLRLYGIDKNERWLQEAKNAFDYFIVREYWKYYDHWLSYAINELTTYLPEDKYFIFGLKNCNGKLDFIYNRETTYPTFMELMMATYKMVKTMKNLKKEHLFIHIDEKYLNETIDRRAEYQRVGFFYPELAMYTKKPSLILHSFFIRHHSFRVRIDDIEHYLSGYIQFFHHRIPDISKENDLI